LRKRKNRYLLSNRKQLSFLRSHTKRKIRRRKSRTKKRRRLKKTTLRMILMMNSTSETRKVYYIFQK
jgi:hypothetical protein